MGGIGDTRPLLLVGDLAIKVADHAGEFGQHHFDLPNPAALLLELKALQPNKRVPRLHSGALLSNLKRERASPPSVHDFETARRCMRKVSLFLRQGTLGRVGRAAQAGPLWEISCGGATREAALAVHLRGSLTIGVERGRKIFSPIQQRDAAFQAAAEP